MIELANFIAILPKLDALLILPLGTGNDLDSVFLSINDLSYEQIIIDISSIYGILFISILSSLMFFHSSLGIETILQDYVHDVRLQSLFISLSKITHAVLLVITLICLYLITGF